MRGFYLSKSAPYVRLGVKFDYRLYNSYHLRRSFVIIYWFVYLSPLTRYGQKQIFLNPNQQINWYFVSLLILSHKMYTFWR
jgi:hypothetical protein